MAINGCEQGGDALEGYTTLRNNEQIRLGETDGYGYVGIMPPPEEKVLETINKRIALDIHLVKSSLEDDAEGNPDAYYEIGFTKSSRSTLIEMGRVVLDTMRHEGCSVTLTENVYNLFGDEKLF